MNIEEARAKFKAPPIPSDVDKMRAFLDKAIYNATADGEVRLTVQVTCTKKLATVMCSHYTQLGFSAEVHTPPNSEGKVCFVLAGWADTKN